MDQPLSSPALRALNDTFHTMIEKSRSEQASPLAARCDRLARLRSVIADNILTREVRRDGLGGIDPARFARAIDEIGEDFRFQKKPQVPDIFDDSFLPPAGLRLIN